MFNYIFLDTCVQLLITHKRGKILLDIQNMVQWIRTFWNNFQKCIFLYSKTMVPLMWDIKYIITFVIMYYHSHLCDFFCRQLIKRTGKKCLHCFFFLQEWPLLPVCVLMWAIPQISQKALCTFHEMHWNVIILYRQEASYLCDFFMWRDKWQLWV